MSSWTFSAFYKIWNLRILFGLWQEKFSAGLSKLNFTCQKNKLRISLDHFFDFFHIFSEKFSDVRRQIFSRPVETVFYVSRWTFFRNKILLIKIFSFVIFFEFWAETSAASGEKLSAGLSELHFRCPEHHFEQMSSWKNNRHFLRLRAKRVRPRCQNGMLRVQNFPRKIFFQKKTINFHILFGFWAKNFRKIGQNFSEVAKTAFYVSRRKIWLGFCWRTSSIPDSFLNSSGNFSDFKQKFFGTVVKIAFCISRATFWATFLKNEFFIFWVFWLKLLSIGG